MLYWSVVRTSAEEESMGANSAIEWTHHTFNPWRGCTRVSAGCKNCYAETMSKRNPGVLGVWGPRGTRVVAAESYWRQPVTWDREAAQAGERRRVFCASLADVFEDDATMPLASREVVWAARERLWALIAQTPNLDWLLLTKRPENILSMIPVPWRFHHGAPHNVWYGTSVEDQATAEYRIPYLLQVPARVRFLSCEPLLGPVDLGRWLPDLDRPIDWVPDGDAPPGIYDPLTRERYPDPADIELHWVIAGGESGHGARPMHSDWARSLRDQCTAAGVSFFMKQMGGTRNKGGDIDAISADLRIREMPYAHD
jgi:protein gp37